MTKFRLSPHVFHASLLLLLATGVSAHAQPRVAPVVGPTPTTTSPTDPRVKNAEEKFARSGNETPSRRSTTRVVVRGNTPFDVLLETANQALNASPPNYASAEAAYRRALRMHPKEVRAHEGLGEVYAAQGLYEKAAEVYEGLVRINPKRPEAHFKLGELYSRVGRKEDALAEVTALRELKKNGLADKLAALIGGN